MLSRVQSIVITGGTSGIGRCLTQQLHAAGHHVSVLARSRARLDQLESESPGVMTAEVDLRCADSIDTAWASLVMQMGKDRLPTFLINGAAIQLEPRFTDTNFEPDRMAEEVAVNLLAPMRLSWHALQIWRDSTEERGIVNLSSGLAYAPKINSAVYCATKSALHSFSQSLRYQTAGSNVRVMEVVLPLVDTPMTAGRGGHKLSADQAARQIVKGVGHRLPDIWVGKTRWLPGLMRLSPSLVRRMMRGA